MLYSSVCEHRADVPWQKVQFLSHLSKGHSPRSFVACQHVVFQILMICFQQWCPPWLSPMKSTLAQTMTDGAI